MFTCTGEVLNRGVCSVRWVHTGVAAHLRELLGTFTERVAWANPEEWQVVISRKGKMVIFPAERIAHTKYKITWHILRVSLLFKDQFLKFQHVFIFPVVKSNNHL